MLNLISGVSQRRTALTMKINLKTVARKLLFLANKARITNMKIRSRVSGIEAFQFDDLETFVHTKLKPLSVVLAVEKRSRHMLGFEVAQMPAKGLLAEKSVKKYGKRMDQRAEARDRLFCRIQNQILPGALIESDDNPHYPASVKAYFPSCIHKTYLGGRSAVTAQGELKKVIQDPLFSLNHTCAMNRYSISRLIRKTWCTTKRIFALADHLEIYMYFHNRYLIKRTAPQKFIQGSC